MTETHNKETFAAARLIRFALGLLLLLAVAVGASSWDRLRQFTGHLEIIPLILLAVVCAVVFLVYLKTREMAELKTTLAGLQGQQQVLTSEMEAQKLLQTVIASREGFRDLIDSFDASVFTVSLDGKIRAANKSFVKALRLTFQDVIGKDLTEFLSSPTLDQFKSGLTEFQKKRHWQGLVRVCIAPQNEWRFFECTVHPVLQDDAVLAVTFIANDVTADRERELQFSTLFETLQEAVWIASSDGRLLDGNTAMATLLGVTDRQLMLGSSVLQRIAEPERKIVERALANREPLRDVELNILRQDGSQSICIANATAVFDVAGTVKYHGTFTDVTARRSMERLLAREQKFREQLIASFPDAIVCTDAEGKFTFLSSHAERMFGGDVSSLAQARLADFADQDDASKLTSSLQQAWNDPTKVVRSELHMKDGSIVQVGAAAVCEEPQQASDVVWSFRDISEQRRVQQELLASERMAAVGQMLEGFSHELNNPLTAIVGAAELLKDETLTENGQRNLDLLQTQTARARELVRNLLLFSSPPTDGRASVNVLDLLQAVIALRRQSLSAHNLTIDIRDSGALPYTSGEPSQLMQMFLNVLVNAEQACTASGGGGTIRIRVGTDGSSIWCTVQDDGPGISLEDAKRIFEPFFTTGRADRRVGLGLSISRSIAKAHGGTIEYKPSPDGGSTMKITLPAGARARTTVNSK